MRIQGLIILAAALGAAQAEASSIQTVQALTGPAPSIITLGDETAIDPSIVAAVSETGPSPSIVAVADTPDTPSIVSLGEPAPAGEEVASTPPASSQRSTMPMVIRGGEVGSVSARPTAAPAEASTEPLLDPNDRGTSAKRKALKRQAERLAREAAEGAQNPQQDFPIPTCDHCEAELMGKRDLAALDVAIKEAYAKALAEKASRCIRDLSEYVPQQELERLLGLSAGYASKLKNGQSDPAAPITALLLLLADDHARLERLRELWKVAETPKAAERPEGFRALLTARCEARDWTSWQAGATTFNSLLEFWASRASRTPGLLGAARLGRTREFTWTFGAMSGQRAQAAPPPKPLRDEAQPGAPFEYLLG